MFVFVSMGVHVRVVTIRQFCVLHIAHQESHNILMYCSNMEVSKALYY